MLDDIIANHYVKISIRYLATYLIISSAQGLDILLACLVCCFANWFYAPIFNMFREIQPESTSCTANL